MTLAICTECGRIIDIDELEELSMDTIMGCGLNVGNFLSCEGCSAEDDPIECAKMREENKFTKTTLSDLELYRW